MHQLVEVGHVGVGVPPCAADRTAVVEQEGRPLRDASHPAEIPSKTERLRGLARELAGLKVDAILAVGADAAAAAKEVTETIPIVYVPAGEAAGAVTGANVTGFTQARRDVVKQLVGQLKEVVPRLATSA